MQDALVVKKAVRFAKIKAKEAEVQRKKELTEIAAEEARLRAEAEANGMSLEEAAEARDRVE